MGIKLPSILDYHDGEYPEVKDLHHNHNENAAMNLRKEAIRILSVSAPA